MRVNDLRMIRRCTMVLAALLAWTSVVRGYMVGPPLRLEELAAEANIIFKGMAVSSGPVQDEWFKPCSGFVPQETHFKVISVLKGESPGTTILFRHYDESPRPQGRMFQPQYYHFQTNRTYIVFAKKGEDIGVYRQLWTNHKGKDDQGVLLCSNDQPLTATPVKQAFWNELTVMLGSADVRNITYAIHQLDQMSGGRDAFQGTQDFDRTKVLAVVHDLMSNTHSEIAQAAIAVVGSHNPYLSDERTEFWLATVGSAEVPGLSKMDPKMKNTGGDLYWRDLVTIADGKASAETRARAIRALGLVREPALRDAINRWLVDPEAMVQASATVLLADFPGTDTAQQLTVLAKDPASVVRACVARAIGFSQQTELVEVLGSLLVDKDHKVSRVASASLLSFSPKDQSVAGVLRANLENAEFHPLFLNALARENPEPHLDALAQVVKEKTVPTNWGGGEIPAFTAWKILFKYIQALPTEVLNSGKVDQYLDAIEQVGNYSSSNQRDIYAFYILKGMADHAKAFRKKANKVATYDLDYYFKQVDQNPSHNSL
jgi:hypothetical protein